MSEGDPLISEVSSGKLDTPKNLSKSPNKGILDGLRRKFVLAAGIGLAGGALGGAFGTQGCTPAESESDEHGHNEKVGSVKQAIWQDPSSEPSWGQDSSGNNGSPFVHWKDANNGIAVFASNKPGGLGGHDIYISTTSAGPDGPWTPETPIDDSLSTIKVNTVGEQTSAVICVGGNCGTGKFFVSSLSQVYEGDFDLSTLQVSNLTKLPTGPTKVNAVGGGSYLSVDAAGSKLYWSNTTKVFTTDIDVNPADATKWNRTEITGFIGATNGTPTVWGSHMMVSTPDGCENIGGSGDLDLCQYDLTGTTVSNHYNANSVPSSLALPNTVQDQITPMVDSKGILWYASRESGPQAKIKRKDPKAVVVPDAGPDGSGGEGGAGGADGGIDSGAGGEGGTGGSDAGVPDADAGMDAAADAPDDVMDAGVDAPDDSMDAGTDASEDAGMDASVDSGDAGEGGADGGPTDAGMPDADAGTPDAGEDAGMDASTDAGDGGKDAGTDAGKPKECAIKVESGPGEVTCDESGSFITMKITADNQEVKFVGPKPGCYVLATKLPNAEGSTITYNAGELATSKGINHADKNVDHCFDGSGTAGLEASYEGTFPHFEYKPEFNKDGLNNVVTVVLPEGQVRYAHNGKPIQTVDFGDKKCMDGKPCEPGQQPANTEISLDLRSFSNINTSQLPTVTPPEAPSDGGCAIAQSPEDTSNGVLMGIAALGIAGLIRRGNRSSKKQV
jgi:hypothetical protein